MLIPFDDQDEIDYADRTFHLEIMRGGMNRLLLRSDRTSPSPARVEILFMNTQYLQIGTWFDGLLIRPRPGSPAWPGERWRISYPKDLKEYELSSQSGSGLVVAGAVAVDESDAEPDDPSSFFMM